MKRPKHHTFHGEWLGGFDSQVAEDLEFDVIQALLASYCHGESATERAEALRPWRTTKRIVPALQTTAELLTIRQEGIPFPRVTCDELLREIRMLKVRDSVLDEAGFLRILDASKTLNALLEALEASEGRFPRMEALAEDVTWTDELIASIESVFDAKGEVRADASNLLVSIRGEMTRVRRAINRAFMRAVKTGQEKGWLADTTEGFINERRVLAVNSTHKRKLSGTVLGQSNNGSITFIEPGACMPLNAEFEMLKDDERKEILRILRDLTQRIRHHLPLIRAYQRVIVELDWTQAKVRLAGDCGGHLPLLRKEKGFHMIQAYHPLLRMQNSASGRHTEPQTVELSDRGRMLVISGPNAGGKSITLKTVGLLQIMLQSGLLIPVHPNSEVGFFDAVLTDIGDNQSIENQLSTYSYRLNRMRGFLEVSGPTSLLLLDEFGTGSDPELGGALAEVFFEELYERGCFGVITTHYANIKTRAAQLPDALNGSMRFDRESLEPLYTLDVGQPGSSFTFEVAEINGIHHGLIERAKAKLDHRRVKLDDLLTSLEREKNQLTKLTDRQLRKDLEVEQLKQALERKQTSLEAKAATQQEIADEQNVALTRGKRMQQFIDRWNVQSKNKELLEDVRKYLAVERARQEDAAALAAAKRTAAKAAAPKRRPKHHVERIQVGSKVRLRNGNERGEVVTVKGDDITVLFGQMRMRVERNKLTWLAH